MTVEPALNCRVLVDVTVQKKLEVETRVARWRGSDCRRRAHPSPVNTGSVISSLVIEQTYSSGRSYVRYCRLRTRRYHTIATAPLTTAAIKPVTRHGRIESIENNRHSPGFLGGCFWSTSCTGEMNHTMNHNVLLLLVTVTLQGIADRVVIRLVKSHVTLDSGGARGCAGADGR